MRINLIRELCMNIESFRRLHKPNRLKRSHLHSVLPEISQLKAEGYTIPQIRKYLESREIDVSLDALQKFWSRNAKAIAVKAP